MLLTVKKQIEETLEVKTPAYYRSVTGFHHINESGQLISIGCRMISIWHANDGKYHNEEIERIVSNGKPCEKEEFEAAYHKAIAEMKTAVGLVEVNS